MKLKDFVQNTLIKLTGYYLQKHEKPPENIDCYITIQKLLNHYRPTVLCDVGSNNGQWAKTLAKLHPSLKEVVFFEPQSKYQAELQKVDIANAQRKVFQLGISDQDGNLAIKGGNASASFLAFDNNKAETFTGEVTQEEEMVAIKTLDGVYQTEQLSSPDLIKVDVQGLELQVLQGGEGLLQKAKYVVLELSFEEFYQGQDPLWKLMKFMEEHQYRLIDFGFEWRVDYKPDNKLVQVDAIFENIT